MRWSNVVDKSDSGLLIGLLITHTCMAGGGSARSRRSKHAFLRPGGGGGSPLSIAVWFHRHLPHTRLCNFKGGITVEFISFCWMMLWMGGLT